MRTCFTIFLRNPTQPARDFFLITRHDPRKEYGSEFTMKSMKSMKGRKKKQIVGRATCCPRDHPVRCPRISPVCRPPYGLSIFMLFMLFMVKDLVLFRISFLCYEM